MSRTRVEPLIRLARRSEYRNGCLVWNGARGAGGYGVFGIHREHLGAHRLGLVHRWAYSHLVGPIPAGMQLDHLCGVRNCWAPWHLEPVSALENVRRSSKVQRTRCLRGHEYDRVVTKRDGTTYRHCTSCHRMTPAQRAAHPIQPGRAYAAAATSP